MKTFLVSIKAEQDFKNQEVVRNSMIDLTRSFNGKVTLMMMHYYFIKFPLLSNGDFPLKARRICGIHKVRYEKRSEAAPAGDSLVQYMRLCISRIKT